jgi:outer membrane protein TolC
VKQAYYSILQSQSALQAAQASVKQYEELDRVMSEKLSQEAALKSDSMEVKAKLAQERYNVLQLTDQLQSRREQLNDLLGRDLATAFRTEDVPAMAAEESDLRAAQQTALSKRPEIRQAEINVQQADYDRRLAKAQYIPDVAVAVHYTSPFNVEFVPKNIVAAGFELNWEPFDWGRRKDEINQKKIVLDQSQLQLKDVQSKVLLDVDNRFRTLQETRVLLTVAKTAADAATEKLREMTQKFGQQSVLLRDVLQQQAAVASANSNYEQALLSFWTSKAEFEKAVGEDR